MPTSGYNFIEVEIDLMFLEDNSVSAVELNTFFDDLGDDIDGDITSVISMNRHCDVNTECTFQISEFKP